MVALNAKVRLLSDRSFGFHGPQPLIALVYLCCTGLHITPPHRWLPQEREERLLGVLTAVTLSWRYSQYSHVVGGGGAEPLRRRRVSRDRGTAGSYVI